MDSETTEYDRMRNMVMSVRSNYETAVRVAQGGFDIDDLADLRSMGYPECECDDSGDCDDDHDDAQEFCERWLFEDPLSIEGVWTGRTKEDADYQGCTVVITTGGPHVELDTVRRIFIGYGWFGADRVELAADADVCGYFDGWFE